MSHANLTAAAVLASLALVATPASAQSSGVDAALFRPTIDTSGVFSLEGARLMPRRDIAWKFLVGYAQKPFRTAVPGIGGGDDTGDDAILKYMSTVELTFGMTLVNKLAIGFGVAAYRADTGEGYGVRGRYSSNDTGVPSTGLLSLRPLGNVDYGGPLDEGLAGPLDVRVVAKYQAFANANLAVSLMAAAAIPFGVDEMYLGDRSFVIEPRLLVDYRLDAVHATHFVANVGAKLRDRTVLEAYDYQTGGTPEMAVVVADIGSELTAGAGFVYELGPTLTASAELVGFVPLPAAASLGSCERYNGDACSDLEKTDYFNGGGYGDPAGYGNVGVGFDASPHLTLQLMGGAGLFGMRRDDFHVTAGLVWSPQPEGVAVLGRGDRDGDGIPDVSDSCIEDTEDKDGYQDDDGCPDVDNDGDGVPDANDSCADEPEDRDGYQDEDGCPERDNDGDGITDVADRCPDAREDFDGFEDDDGCPEEDNDGDGFPDSADRCPNDPETVNGVDDDDGCPDTRASTGPEEGSDRINLKGNRIEFSGAATLTNATKTILGQIAGLVRDRGLSIRIEVHVPLGTSSKSTSAIKKQRQKDKDLSQRRAQAILDYLIAQGVPAGQVQAVGLGSDRPLGNNPPTDPLNERVDFIKAQQRTP